MEFLESKTLALTAFRNIDEPVICGVKAIFIQNSYNGSKIVVYNILTRKIETLARKNILCFNVHADGDHVVYEFSGARRGIGIMNTSTLDIKEYPGAGGNILLGGIWRHHVIIRHDNEVLLLDIERDTKKHIATCRHICGVPVVGCGNCAWVQAYKEKCCIVLYNIEKEGSLIIPSCTFDDKLYLVEDHIVYENCCNNKCYIYMHNIHTGRLKIIFESSNWVDIYISKDNMLVWTEKKECGGRYVFDTWIYRIPTNSLTKLLSDNEKPVIPTISGNTVLWMESGSEGDSVYLMSVNI